MDVRRRTAVSRAFAQETFVVGPMRGQQRSLGYEIQTGDIYPVLYWLGALLDSFPDREAAAGTKGFGVDAIPRAFGIADDVIRHQIECEPVVHIGLIVRLTAMPQRAGDSVR